MVFIAVKANADSPMLLALMPRVTEESKEQRINTS
jgi:hypothetical protein